jgi:hypothetical protein
MDAVTFLSDVVPSRARGSEWFMAVGKLCTGLLLYFVVARRAGGETVARVDRDDWIIFILHFGGFHLLALAWRSCGVPAQPIMRIRCQRLRSANSGVGVGTWRLMTSQSGLFFDRSSGVWVRLGQTLRRLDSPDCFTIL